jgi:hypothetical protein
MQQLLLLFAYPHDDDDDDERRSVQTGDGQFDSNHEWRAISHDTRSAGHRGVSLGPGR